jgi:ribosomal protein S18 acetylase RimI-like enzyme
MKYRHATLDDVPILAKMNRRLTEDEQHRNQFKSDEWFKERMESFLKGEYEAIIFEKDGKALAYALYRDHPEHDDTIYLRQIFVDRFFRRQGFGRKAMKILMKEVWPREKRLTVEVLSSNEAAFLFYKSVGYKECSLELEIKAEERTG